MPQGKHPPCMQQPDPERTGDPQTDAAPEMFTIEFEVVVLGQAHPGAVIEGVWSAATSLAMAEQTARGLLNKVRTGRRNTLPDGYQIIDDVGVTVLRSWDAPRAG
jgi:hypothetical protein